MRGLLSQKRILWRLVMTLAGFVFYGLGVCHYRLLVQSPVIWQIECGEDGSQTEEDYERIRESQEKEGQQGGKEPAVASAFWRKEEGQTAENPSLNRTAAVTVWKVRGSLEVLFQSSAALAEEDWQGCYLSADIAWELFGSQDVSGNQLTCGTRQLMVRGILEEETALLIMRPEAAETTNRITLEEESSVRVENFLMSYNLPGRASGTGVLAEILQWILLLFPGVLAAGFLMNFSGLLAEKREYVLFQAVGKAVWWFLMLGAGYLLFRNIHIPETMIPDRWSDFRFWKDWWEAFREQVVCFLKMDKTGYEMRCVEHFIKGTVFSFMPFLTMALKK